MRTLRRIITVQLVALVLVLASTALAAAPALAVTGNRGGTGWTTAWCDFYPNPTTGYANGHMQLQAVFSPEPGWSSQLMAWNPWVRSDMTQEWTNLGWKYIQGGFGAVIEIDGWLPHGSYLVTARYAWWNGNVWTISDFEPATTYSTNSAMPYRTIQSATCSL